MGRTVEDRCGNGGIGGNGANGGNGGNGEDRKWAEQWRIGVEMVGSVEMV